MSSEVLIIVTGIILSTMLTIISFNFIPSFWENPFLIVVLGVFAVFVTWFMAFNALVNTTKR